VTLYSDRKAIKIQCRKGYGAVWCGVSLDNSSWPCTNDDCVYRQKICLPMHAEGIFKMVNDFRYYRVLESVSIASAMSTALTIYPCQIRVHQRWQSTLQLPTARKEWRPATVGSSPPCGWK